MKSLLKFSFLLCILKSMNYWMLWYTNTRIVYLLTLLLIIICVSNKQIDWKKKINGNYIVGFVFFAIFAILQNYTVLANKTSLLSYSNTFLLLGIFYAVLRLGDKFKEELVGFVEKSMIYLLVPALIVFFANFFVNLPYIPAVYMDSFGNEPYGLLKNYIFLIHHADAIADLASFPRFCGPFLEPGQLATFLSFLLLLLKFDFSKKSRYVLLVALLVSFSLAGYVLALMGALLVKSHKMKKLLPLVSLLVIVYLVGINYNNGDNLLNKYILVRLEYDEEKGISGNDRSSAIADKIFEEELMVNSKNFLFGLPHYRGEAIGGSGYKFYLINYGFFNLIFLLLSYIVISGNAKNKRDMLIFLVLIIASFLQRATPLIFYIPFMYFFALDNNKQQLTVTRK